MKKITLTLVLAMMLVACSHGGKQPADEYAGNAPVHKTDTSIPEDAVGANAKKPKDKPAAASSPSLSSKSQPSRRHQSAAQDNMRGFDPASEDDMDDNGMSRYMENDDDEGWD